MKNMLKFAAILAVELGPVASVIAPYVPSGGAGTVVPYRDDVPDWMYQLPWLPGWLARPSISCGWAKGLKA